MVGAWRASGKSQRAFAREHGLRASTLASWARKLRRKGQREAEPASFSEVRVVPSAAPAAAPGVVLVTTPGGFVVQLTGQLDASTLRAVLEEVSRC